MSRPTVSAVVTTYNQAPYIEAALSSIEYYGQRFRTFQEKADLERQQLRHKVINAIAAGYVSELQASKLAGVTRQTVRSWLGK